MSAGYRRAACPLKYLDQLAIVIGNRQTAIATEGASGDFDAGRGLAAFVFAVINQAYDAFHRFALVAHGHYFVERAILFGIGAQDGIEYIIGRQAVGVLLVGAQFGRGRLVDYRWGDNGSPG